MPEIMLQNAFNISWNMHSVLTEICFENVCHFFESLEQFSAFITRKKTSRQKFFVLHLCDYLASFHSYELDKATFSGCLFRKSFSKIFGLGST